MQQCNCRNTYRYIEDNKSVCVVCGEDWPSHSDETLDKTKELYRKHMNFPQNINHFMWDQCSHEYQQAWLTIAGTE